jgi:hypothetical protein
MVARGSRLWHAPNICFLMTGGERNDLLSGRAAAPRRAGAVTPETFAWWTSHVESAGKDEIIITRAHSRAARAPAVAGIRPGRGPTAGSYGTTDMSSEVAGGDE